MVEIGKRRVLVIEDDIGHAEVLSLVLRNEMVIVAPTIADAMSTLDKDQFDLVILNLQLPDGNGEDVLKELREDGSRHKDVSVVVYTGHTSFEMRDKYLKLGANLYLVKPASVSKIRQALGVESISESERKHAA